jgi:hypothetical protein
MKRRRSLYARPAVNRGQQCAKGAAWPPAEDRAAVGQCSRQARALAGDLTAFAIPAASWCHGVRTPTVALVALSGSSVSVGVSDVRCLSSVRPSGTRPVSGRLVSDVRCPVLGVRCPVSVSGARCPCPVPGVRCGRPASVSTLSAPVNSWSACAAGSHTSRDRPGRVTT